MKFSNLSSDSKCICLKDTAENLEDTFCRKIKNNELSESDFISNWENGIRVVDKKVVLSDNCGSICLLKGISIDIIDINNRNFILEKYRTTFKFNPTMRKYVCEFKFLKDAGQLKHNPSDKDPYHYTFYKSDDFDLTKINVLNTFTLRDENV
jgi:hypothetical protein